MPRPGKFIVCLSLVVCAQANADVALLLFGGDNHKTFLGCLNCNPYQSESICNAYGSFGSIYSSDSIWNAYGTFGSKYSSQSPWNQYASDPPVIVDSSGNSYGYLTANRYFHDRTGIKGFIALTDAAGDINDLHELADAYCGR
jgi:hypothetical protein